MERVRWEMCVERWGGQPRVVRVVETRDGGEEERGEGSVVESGEG